jgi:6-phosphofructo-2-kinase
MTRSRVSPDGRIAPRDVAAKLVIVMVGLPARGKSYITKKIQRYLSWQQHNSRIFNVGNRRRVAAGIVSPTSASHSTPTSSLDMPSQAAAILLNGVPAIPEAEPTEWDLNSPSPKSDKNRLSMHAMDQSAKFFDPGNQEASKLREQVAMDTLDELLDYLLNQGGSVGILDATNSTIHRRQLLVDRIKAKEPKLGILFIESICDDKNVSIRKSSPQDYFRKCRINHSKLLEANMRLKLSGPDYKDKDPVKSLADFRERVKGYEKAYQPLGEYEERHDMQYIQVRERIPHYTRSIVLNY